jgi:hypothetical protein
MKSFRVILWFAVPFLTLFATVAAVDGDYSTYGTLIGVLGNKNGTVVFTDSRASYKDAKGVLQIKPGDFQKLLQFDDGTVCAIAGLGSANVHVASELNADILGVIQRIAMKVEIMKGSLLRITSGVSLTL